jgi:hypothetical protein
MGSMRLPPSFGLWSPHHLRPVCTPLALCAFLKIVLRDVLGQLIRPELGDVLAFLAPHLDVRGAGVKKEGVEHVSNWWPEGVRKR